MHDRNKNLETLTDRNSDIGNICAKVKKVTKGYKTVKNSYDDGAFVLFRRNTASSREKANKKEKTGKFFKAGDE